MTDEETWVVRLAPSHMEAVVSLADELDRSDDMPTLIDSSADGWALGRWYNTITAPAADLRALCRSLASTGRKSDAEIAGRIRARAAKAGCPGALDWPGITPMKRPSKPRGVEAVAAAWKAGRRLDGGNVGTDGATVWSWRLPIGITTDGRKVAIDYRGRVSLSTSRHCGVVIAVADCVREPTREEWRS